MYNFEGIEKKLLRKTFSREEKAKEVAGITVQLGNEISSLTTQFSALYEIYKQEKDELKQAEIMDRLLGITGKTDKLRLEMQWELNFDKAIAVMDVLLAEGSAGLTKDNFSADDAKVVWEDFFTQKSNIKSTESTKS